MRILLILALATSGCAATSAAQSKSLAAASGLQCGDLLPGIASKGAGVYPGPDDTLRPLRWLEADTPVCASPDKQGFGFRRVRFADGSTAYVQDEYVLL